MAAKTSDPIDILLEMGIDLDNLSEEEDYLSALKEAIAKIQFQTKGAGDERQRILQEEVIKVRKSRKAADPKFKAKKTTIKPDAFFDKKKPEDQAQPVPGQKALPGQQTAAIVKRQTISPEVFKRAEEPEVDDDKKKRVRKKTSDPLKDILKAVNSILATLKNQNKLTKKQAERDRKDAEKAKRGAQEDDLEQSPLKKFFDGAKKLAKPAIGFFESIMNFIMKVLIGRLLVKILGWMGDPKNEKKMKAIMDFFKVTWPAFLAAFLAFKFGLVGFIGNLIGTIGRFIPRILRLIPKMVKGLARLAMANPIATAAVAVVAGTAIAAVASNQEGTAVIKDPKDPDKSHADEIREYGGMTGAPISADMLGFSGGGKVPGSGPNKDTVPAMLTPGEFVMSRGAVQEYGVDTLESMNAMGGGTNMPTVAYNGGGVVRGYNGGGQVDPESGLPMKSAQNKETGKADTDKDALTETISVPKDGSTPGQQFAKGNFGQAIKQFLFGSDQTSDSDGGGEEEKSEETPVTLGEPAKSLIGNDTEFLTKVDEVSQKIGANPADLLGLMASESGLDPQAVNSSSGATGLIQFIPSTAASLGTSVGALRGMNRAQQMEYVEKFLLKTAPPNPTPGHLYTSVFLPAFAKKPADYVIAKKGGFTSSWGHHPASWYAGNAGLDMNRDGSIQIEELGKRIKDKQKAFGIGGGSAVQVSSIDSSEDLSPSGGGPSGPSGADTQPPSAQMKPAGESKPLPPPSRGQKLSDLYAQQEKRAGRGPSPSPGAEGANPGATNTPNSNDLPPIDANAMISMEKIKVLGLTVV